VREQAYLEGTMIAFLVGIIFVAAVGLFVLGNKTGNAANPPTVLPRHTDGPGDCNQACIAWDNARQMQCGARADEVAARSRADGIRNAMIAALAAAVSLSVAGAATIAAAAAATATFFGIPAGIILTGIAIGLFVLAAAATAAALVLAGQLGAAEGDAAEKAMARQLWDAAVATARADVNRLCTTAEANACLSRPAPC
jgi:hypothetical protein